MKQRLSVNPTEGILVPKTELSQGQVHCSRTPDVVQSPYALSSGENAIERLAGNWALYPYPMNGLNSAESSEGLRPMCIPTAAIIMWSRLGINDY